MNQMNCFFNLSTFECNIHQNTFRLSAIVNNKFESTQQLRPCTMKEIWKSIIYIELFLIILECFPATWCWIQTTIKYNEYAFLDSTITCLNYYNLYHRRYYYAIFIIHHRSIISDRFYWVFVIDSKSQWEHNIIFMLR